MTFVLASLRCILEPAVGSLLDLLPFHLGQRRLPFAREQQIQAWIDP
jgi:hypothetical protein